MNSKLWLALDVALPAVTLVVAYPVVFAMATDGDADFGLGPIWMAVPAVTIAVLTMVRRSRHPLRRATGRLVVLGATLYPFLNGDDTYGRAVFAAVAAGLVVVFGSCAGSLVRALLRAGSSR